MVSSSRWRGYELEAMLNPTLTNADVGERIEVVLRAMAPN